MSLHKIPKPRYLGVYVQSRHFGGREEGGWWYDNYTWVASRVVDHSSPARIRRLKKELAEKFEDLAWGDVNSVLDGEAVVIFNEQTPGDQQYTERPRYE